MYLEICRRKTYDQTGSLEDSEALSGEQFESLYEYYRNIYKKVSEEDIEEVEEQYRGSQEEQQDVLKFYSQFKGNMEKVGLIHLLSISQWLTSAKQQHFWQLATA